MKDWHWMECHRRVIVEFTNELREHASSTRKQVATQRKDAEKERKRATSVYRQSPDNLVRYLYEKGVLVTMATQVAAQHSRSASTSGTRGGACCCLLTDCWLHVGCCLRCMMAAGYCLHWLAVCWLLMASACCLQP